MEIKNIIEKFKISIVTILFVALIISLGVNFIYYKGMTFNVDKRVTQNNDQRQYQFQQQWQGQLLINQWTAQGNKIEWKKIEIKGYNVDAVIQELNKLHPISAFYSKINFEFSRLTGENITIIYPDVFEMKLNKQRQVK